MSDEKIDPQAEDQPKITGYKKHTEAEIELVNTIKYLENSVGIMVEGVRAAGGADPRMVALAVTNIQQGFMWLVRSIFQPGSRL